VNADINVTPMIDVMLVLLIIFMIVTPLLAAGFQATMPTGSNLEKQEEKEHEITLGLDVSGNYFVNKQPIAEALVEDSLRRMFAADPLEHRLFFKADAGLPYSKVQAAIEKGRRAGARNLIAIADKKGGLMADEKGKK
jgi:biopolymer transport protein ExbD